jgi:hypothetical protein
LPPHETDAAQDWIEIICRPQDDGQLRTFLITEYTIACHEDDGDRVKPFMCKIEGAKAGGVVTWAAIDGPREVRSRTLIQKVKTVDPYERYRLTFTGHRGAVIDAIEFFGTINIGGKPSGTFVLAEGRAEAGQQTAFGSLPEATGALGAILQDGGESSNAGAFTQRGRLYFEDFEMTQLSGCTTVVPPNARSQVPGLESITLAVAGQSTRQKLSSTTSKPTLSRRLSSVRSGYVGDDVARAVERGGTVFLPSDVTGVVDGLVASRARVGAVMFMRPIERTGSNILLEEVGSDRMITVIVKDSIEKSLSMTIEVREVGDIENVKKACAQFMETVKNARLTVMKVGAAVLITAEAMPPFIMRWTSEMEMTKAVAVIPFTIESGVTERISTDDTSYS